MRLFEFILNENRAPALAQKYQQKILQRAKADKSSNIADERNILSFLQNLELQFSKYVEWVLIKWINNNFLIEDLPRVKATIEQFKLKQSQLEKKDINQYKTLNELEDAVGLLDDVKSARHQKQEIKAEGIKKIVDNDRVLIAQLLTEQAACYYGKGTKWCTAGESNNMFDSYASQGPLYFVIDKQTNEKFQISYAAAQCMNAADRPVNYQKLLKKFPELKQIEPKTAKGMSLDYFLDFMEVFKNNKRWPEAELDIMKNAESAYQYARDIIEGRWPEAEPYIMKDAHSASMYANDVLNSRWPEAEPYIIKNAHSASMYARDIIKGRWPEAESYIMKDAFPAYLYAMEILNGRWPEAESYIMKEPGTAYQYARNIIKDRWPEAEAVIADSVIDKEKYERQFGVKL